MTNRTHPRRGFTLIELLIALAIIAVLAAIAVPSYQSYIQSARRADGQASLQRIMLEQEKWRSNNSEYTDTLSDLGFVPDPAGHYESTDGHYDIDIPSESVNETSYTAIATATGGQANDTACAAMTLEVDGADVTTEPDGCWKQ